MNVNKSKESLRRKRVPALINNNNSTVKLVVSMASFVLYKGQDHFTLLLLGGKYCCIFHDNFPSVSQKRLLILALEGLCTYKARGRKVIWHK